jgi:SSS family solute:Na+ symporter
MIPVTVVLIYLLIVAGIGAFAFRKAKANTEDFFLASRGIGSMVFFLSLFATNMTAFAILGSSGQAYRQGIGVYGLMASSSGLIIPLTIFLIGTRLWALGKRFGFQTQVQFFRDRWECNAIGTIIFTLSTIMLVPYMIISIMGGGRVLSDISGGVVHYWLGCAVVALVVTINASFGGMRGTVWVNVFQTILFLLFGAVAIGVISHSIPGGFGEYIQKIVGNPSTSFLGTRERMSERYFWSYTFIPLSSIMFPHMAIMCFAARKVTAFKRTVVLYPLAIMAIWLPCVFLGVIGTQTDPGLKNADGILLHMLTDHAPVLLAGILGAGIISAVMGSDTHQVLAVSTMFTKDVFSHYGGTQKYGEKGTVYFARGFIILVTLAAYAVALITPESIFELAVRFAFSGFAAMSPVMVAALFWKRSTKYGALASTLWVASCLLLTWFLHDYSNAVAPKPGQSPVVIFNALGHLFERGTGGVTIFGFMPVVPMVIGSAIMMIVTSLFTRPPSKATVDKYFLPQAKSSATV